MVDRDYYRRHFSTVIDLRTLKRITLSDIIDVNVLVHIMEEQGFSTAERYETADLEAMYLNTSKERRVELFNSADNLEQIFGMTARMKKQ